MNFVRSGSPVVERLDVGLSFCGVSLGFADSGGVEGSSEIKGRPAYASGADNLDSRLSTVV